MGDTPKPAPGTPPTAPPTTPPATPPASSRPFALANIPENEFLALSTALAIALASGLNGRDTGLLADFVDAVATSIDVLASVRLYREGSRPPIISPPGVLGAASGGAPTPARVPFRQRRAAPKRNP